MKTHIETVDGKFVVTIGDTKFTLTETSIDVQSQQAVTVRMLSEQPIRRQAEPVSRRSAYDLSDSQHPLRNPLSRKKMLS